MTDYSLYLMILEMNKYLQCGANENDTTDVLGPGSTPVIRMIEEGGCDNSLWQTIETQEGCLAAKWINPDWNALNNGAVPTEVTAAEGSMFQVII